MRIRTIGSLALSISTLAVLVTSGMAYAQQPVKKLTPSAARVVKPASLNLPCDVSISYIQYFNCPCNINLDAYYVDKYLSVKLFNESTLKPTVELKVKYFDMMQNRLLTITRNVTFNGRGSKNVVIHNNRPMLIKKSYGVQAEVALKSTNMHDPDMSNNQRTQLICGPVVE
jgi:hypothetical protein